MNVITLETRDLTLQTAFRLILKFKHLSDLIIHADVFCYIFSQKMHDRWDLVSYLVHFQVFMLKPKAVSI